MDITLLQENLLHVLTRVSRIIPSRPQLPILQNLLLRATTDGLEVTATNMETSEVVWIGGKVEKQGELCVLARVFFELIGSLPPESVHLTAKEEQLSIRCGGFQAEIPSVSAKEFPPIPVL